LHGTASSRSCVFPLIYIKSSVLRPSFLSG
jgi:hypothetical protein